MRGLLAVLLTAVERQPPQQLLMQDPLALFDELGLREQLSASRSSGLDALARAVRTAAATLTRRLRHHLLKDVRHRHKTEGGRHHGGGAETGGAVHPFWAFRSAARGADAAVRLRIDQRFGRKYAVDAQLALTVLHHVEIVLQALAQLRRQRILNGFRRSAT